MAPRTAPAEPVTARPARERSVAARRFVSVAVAAAVVAADQVTKTMALHLPPTTIGGHPARGEHLFGTLYLNLTFNSGTAFGLGSGVTPIVEAVVVVLVGGLLVVGRRASRTASVPVSIGLGLLVGGAIGNLVDRFFRGYHGAVVDFIDVAQVHAHEYWPVFNVADACVVVGAIVLALSYLRASSRRGAGGVAR